MAASYVPLRKMLPANLELDYLIIENEEVVECGNKLFEVDHQIKFSKNIPRDEKRFHIVHSGSSLNYAERYADVLLSLSELKPEYMIFADLPVCETRAFVTTQHYYGSFIPSHVFLLNDFIKLLEKNGFDLLFKARFMSRQFNPYVESVKSFGSGIGIDFFCQLIFRRKDSTKP